MFKARKNNPDSLPRLAVGQCPVCGSAGALVHFVGETLPIVVGELSDIVTNLSGHRCQVCEDVLLDEESDRRFAASGDELVMKERRAGGAILKAVRKRLGLTQSEVGLLVGGGHNGVSRYESGKADPGPAAFNLLHLLDRHPMLAGELPGVVVTRVGKRAHLTSTMTDAHARTIKPNKVIRVDGHDVVIHVDPVAVLGTVSRAGKRHTAKQVDVARLVVAKAAAERPHTDGKRLAARASTKPAASKKAR